MTNCECGGFRSSIGSICERCNLPISYKKARDMLSPNISWTDYCNIKRMNGSTIVAGMKSMLRLKRCIDGGYPEESNVMRIGTGVHALLLEPQAFIDRFVIMPDFHLHQENMRAAKNKSESDDDRRTESKATNYYKQRRDEFISSNQGKSILPQETFNSCLKCIAALRSRPAIRKHIDGANTEVTVLGEIECVEFKGRIDILKPSAIVDLKTTNDVTPRLFGRIFANFHYGEKLAIYRELVRQNTAGERDVFIIAQEPDGDFDNCVIPIPDAVLDNGLERVKRLVRKYKECLATNVWPGVDGGEDEVPLYVPQWAMEDSGDELVAWSE